MALIFHKLNRIAIYPESFPKPPFTEQQDIVNFLDCETAKIDDLIAKARHAIKLLKEHRTALISAAVTGKIDARNEHLSNQPYAG
jgi:type I restriction enzyme S subunit